MELRYIVIALSALAIVGILTDLWMRRKKALKKRGFTKNDSPIEPQLSDLPVDDFPFAELPSGGARVRQVTPEEILQLDAKFKFKTRVPLLMDSVEDLPSPDKTEEAHGAVDIRQQTLDFDQEFTAVKQPTDSEEELNFDEPLFLDDTESFDEALTAWDLPQTDSVIESDTVLAPKTSDGVDDTEAQPVDEQTMAIDGVDEVDEFDKEPPNQAAVADSPVQVQPAVVREAAPTVGSRHQHSALKERREPSIQPIGPALLDEPNSPLLDPMNLASPEDSDWDWNWDESDTDAEADQQNQSNAAAHVVALDDIARPKLRQKTGHVRRTPEDERRESIDLFATPPPGQDLVEPDEVIVINVVADGGLIFAGDQLLEIALACGMRFGAMDIFHRTDSTGRLQFSMASCTKPGTFDIDAISETTVSGVSLFMTLPCSSDAMQSFEYMSETANVLARHLKGVMKDESHNVMRGQTIEHCRTRIREYARAQLLNHE